MASALERELTAITEEFVARIVAALRNASFGDVAALGGPTAGKRAITSGASSAPASSSAPKKRAPRAYRGELAERIEAALKKAGEPLGARAIASELGVAPDRLVAPLKDLRDAGRVKKHGDKRATTYSAT